MSKVGTMLRAVLVGSTLVLASSAAFAGLAPPPTNEDDTSDTVQPVIPEPTAALVMAAGLGVVGLATRRRRPE
jgi:hypothetical protein